MSGYHTSQGWGRSGHLNRTYGNADPATVRTRPYVEADFTEWNAGVERARSAYRDPRYCHPSGGSCRGTCVKHAGGGR